MYKKYLSIIGIALASASMALSCVMYSKVKKLEKDVKKLSKVRVNVSSKPKTDLDEYIETEETNIENDADIEDDAVSEESEDEDVPIQGSSEKFIISIVVGDVDVDNFDHDVIVKVSHNPSINLLRYKDLTPIYTIKLDPDDQKDIVSTISTLADAYPNSVFYLSPKEPNAIDDDKMDYIKNYIIARITDRNLGDKIFTSIDDIGYSEKTIGNVTFVNTRTEDYLYINDDRLHNSQYTFKLNKRFEFLNSDYVFEVNRNGIESIDIYPEHADDENVPVYCHIEFNPLNDIDLINVIFDLKEALPNSVIRVYRNPVGYNLIDEITRAYPDSVVENFTNTILKRHYIDIRIKSSGVIDQSIKEPADSVGHVDYD